MEALFAVRLWGRVTAGENIMFLFDFAALIVASLCGTWALYVAGIKVIDSGETDQYD